MKQTKPITFVFLLLLFKHKQTIKQTHHLRLPSVIIQTLKDASRQDKADGEYRSNGRYNNHHNTTNDN
jgi:hypothetical protein